MPISTPPATGYVTWLKIISGEKGSKPITERDFEHFGLVAMGIEAQAAEIGRLKDREEHLLNIIRGYNPDDALFDDEKTPRHG